MAAIMLLSSCALDQEALKTALALLTDPTATAQSITLAQDTVYTSDGSSKPHLTGISTEGLALTCTQVANPSHGAVTVNSDCSFVYTPTSGYSGSDSFTFKVSDTKGTSLASTVSITVTATATTVPDLASSLVFLEFLSNNTNDSRTSSPHNFTSAGGVSYIANDRGSKTALSLDGVDDYIYYDVANGSTFLPNSYKFTISLWFSTSATGVQTIMHEKYTVQVRDYLKISINNGTVTAAYSTDYTGSNEVILNSTTTGLNDGAWHHLVFVRDNLRTGKLYIDNTMEAEDTNNSGSAGGISPIDSHLYVGRNVEGTQYFNGKISEFYWVYDVAFDATKVNTMFNH